MIWAACAVVVWSVSFAFTLALCRSSARPASPTAGVPVRTCPATSHDDSSSPPLELVSSSDGGSRASSCGHRRRHLRSC
jgi:hypothetical protein